jgi:hypothetical protein
MKRIITAIFSLVLVLSLALVAAPSPALAGVPTLVSVPFCEDFEGGAMPADWSTGGLLGAVDVLHYVDNFDPDFPAPPVKGYYGVLLSNGGTGLGGENGDLDDNGYNDWDTSVLGFAFDLSPAQVPVTLSFQWSFMTSDEDGEEYDDFFMVTLNGDNILSRSCPGTSASPFPDSPPLDGVVYGVDSPGPTNGSYFDDGATSFQQFSYEIASPGSYTVVFLVADQEDDEADSGLLIDDVCVGPPPPGAGWDEGDDYKMHHPQLPELDGGQVFESSVNEEGTAGMADDFLCTENGYITDIHVWGGWYEDEVCDDASFAIGIFSNIAEDDPENPEDYSMPGELLWEREFGPGDYSWRFCEHSETIAYFYPMSSGSWSYVDCSDVYQYNFFIDAEDAFYQEEGSIYWLSVVVTYACDEEWGEEEGMWWGWISCLPEDQWNDDGVWAPIELPEEWQELFYLEYIEDNGDGWYPSEDSADLAFVITTTPPPPPPAVGGELFPVNKLGILVPWLALALLLAVGGAYAARLTLRRVKAKD